jgi:hypothetical protein
MASGAPTPDLIQQTTETVARFIQWVAELIRRRNWFMLLVLVGVALAVLGTAFREQINTRFLADTVQGSFWASFWTGVVLLFLGALAVAVVTMPRPVPVNQADVADRKAIKGLRPFELNDADVFAELQRQGSLRECLDSITGRSFRFGILHGESGCGKTSFLQAGILPKLAADNIGHVGVYVRFSDREPIRTIAQAIAEQLELPLEWLLTDITQQDSLQSLLVKVTDNLNQPLILLLDQFEQFFVHNKRREQRQPFVQALRTWYHSDHSPPVKVVVSIRSDLMYQLDELHQALGYSLAPQDIFRLEKFTPTEACRVLEVIAQTEGLDFNRSFISELAQEELADREDGLISPVDLQILSWMIERQTTEELRAFNRSAFEKFGGVEGLLQRFLERTLEARVSESQRQSVMKVLLALTDLERQVRAGMLTASELTAKLQGLAKPEEVNEAISWLVRGDVRLITPQEKDGDVAYELAHERLIPALMRQAGKELSAVDKANQLLDRRANEWLGNRCDSRYLFGPREIWLLIQQKPYLVWGAKREQKEKLLRLSQRRVYGGLAAVSLMILIVSGLSGWLTFTPSGQIYKIKWQLSSLLAEANSGDMIVDAAVAFAKNEQWEKAFQVTQKYLQPKTESTNTVPPKDKDLATFIEEATRVLVYASPPGGKLSTLTKLETLAESIQDDFSKSSALRAIAAAYGNLEDPTQAQAILADVLADAQTIQDDRSKSYALRAIAAAAGNLEDPTQAQAILADVLAAAQTIQSDFSKSSALCDIAAAAGNLEDPTQAQAILADVLAAAQTIQSDFSKSSALRAIAAAYGNLEDPTQAQAILADALADAQTIQDDFSKSSALRAIAAAYGNLEDPTQAQAIFADALAAAQTIQDDSSKSFALRDIAAAAGNLEDPTQAQAILADALAAAQTIQSDFYKSDALRDIAAAAGNLEDPTQAQAILADALTAAQTIQDDFSKSSALRDIAAAAGNLEDPTQAQAILADALAAAQTIQDDSSKSSALSAIAAAYGNLEDPTQAQAILADALAAAQTIQDDSSKSSALRDIAAAAGNLEDPTQAQAILAAALAAAQIIQDDRSKSSALRDIAAAAGNLEDPTQAQAILADALTAAQTIQSDFYKSDALRDIISTAIALTDNRLVKEFLTQAVRVIHRENLSVPMVIGANYYAKQVDWFHALQTLRPTEKREKIIGLSQLLTVLAEHKNTSLIKGAIILPHSSHGIEYSGQPKDYTLTVKIQSPDESCQKYADWWEILTPEGKLIDRQLLQAPHRDEQPFLDSLEKVSIEADQAVIIRAHFEGEYVSGNDPLEDDRFGQGYISKSGYTDQALQGSINEGFEVVRISENFANWLEQQEPLPEPNDCKEE